MKADLLQGFYLGDFLVEPLKGQVTGRLGSNHLPPKAVEVLLRLAQSPGELVTRNTLLNEAWGSGKGSSEALSHAVSEIRHALGDHADNPVFIQTLPRRGYRLAIAPELAKDFDGSVVLGTKDGGRPGDIGLLENLKQRGVIETALAYLIVGWLLIQVADIVFEQLHFPDWAGTFVTALVIAGFPIAIMLSWFLEFRDGRAVVHQLSVADARKRRFSRTYLSVLGAFVLASIGVYVYDQSIGLPEAKAPVSLATTNGFQLPPIVENSFAVLPFLNLDGSPETQIFADGLVDDVINQLSRVPGLRVASRGDSFSLAPNSASKTVRERLRVEMYIEGSVEMAADMLRVTVQMIDSESGFHILSRQFDRPREEFFSVRDEITNLTVANVRVALPPDIRASSLKVLEDPSLNAYVLYRHGIEDSRRPTTIDTIASALGWFDAALNVDPDYAAAHAGKCALYAKGYSEVDDASFITKAESSCATALALNPNLDMVHTALGDLYQSTGRHTEAEKAYEQALANDPSNVAALTGLGRTYQRLNRLDEAEASLRQAIDIHPGDAAAYNTLGIFLFQTGHFDEAATQYEFAVALEPGDMHWVSNLASAYMLQGDFESAAPTFQRAIDIEPTKLAYSNLGLMQYYLGDLDAAVESLSAAVDLQPNDHLARSNLGDALWIAGRKDEARATFRSAEERALGALQINPKDPMTLMDLAWIKTSLDQHVEARELIERAKKSMPDDPYVHYINGLMHNRLGETADAIDAFETAVELGYSKKLLVGDPNISNLKQDSRFESIVGLSE
ncbi:MAG: tetratricopeptide repeat protein [Gammaproteobacteria bacterium]|nr:tetratricopeptide repeat protein [Gammaproteobacteria bacterium]